MRVKMLLPTVLALGCLLLMAAMGADPVIRRTTGVNAAQVPADLAVARSRVGRIDFADVLPEQAGGSISFNLFRDVTLNVTIDRIERRGPMRASWFGSIEGATEGGLALIVQYDDAYIAYLLAGPLGSFQIRPAQRGTFFVMEIDETAYPECGCGFDHEVGDGAGFGFGGNVGGSAVRTDGEDEVWQRDGGLHAHGGGGDGGGEEDGGDDGSIFDVAIFYTPEAAAAAGGISAIEAVVQGSIDLSNEAYGNSQILPRMNLVHSGQTVQNESGGMSAQLSALRDPGDGLYDEVHGIRDGVAADLVALLCEDGSYCGIAYLMTTLSNGFAANAFSVSNWSCAVGNKTFPHELGHNMGCAHDRDNAGSALFDYSYGWRWFGNSNNQYRSIMAYAPGSRVAHFSNPNVLYDGVPTGVASSEENARSINEAALTIANWRVSVRPLTFDYPDGFPVYIDVDGGTAMRVDVIDGSAAHQEGTALLWFDDGDAFESVPMNHLGGNTYEAVFPAVACGEVNFYVSAETTDAQVITDPGNAPASAYSRPSAEDLTIVLDDDFETDLGWTVDNFNLTDGAWERGIPAGNGSRGDPTADFDGSGQCYVTDNAAGNSDVDGGPTRLTSPQLALASVPEAQISYARWFFNDDRDEDRFIVEVSNDDGASWVLVESIADTGGTPAWVQTAFRVADYVSPTDQVRVRFSVTDNPNNSVTEAGVDAFAASSITCDGGGGDTLLTGFDVTYGTYISGDIAELIASDNTYFRARSGPGFQASEPYLKRIEFDFNTTEVSRSTLDVTVEARLDTPGGTARLRMFVWSQGQYTLLDTWAVGMTDIINDTNTSNAPLYINAQDDLRMQLEIVVAATFSPLGFVTLVDEVSIDVN